MKKILSFIVDRKGGSVAEWLLILFLIGGVGIAIAAGITSAITPVVDGTTIKVQNLTGAGY